MISIQKQRASELAEIIAEQIQQLVSYDLYVPQIEIDIVKKNLQELYETLNKINKKENHISKDTQLDEETAELLDVAEQQFSKLHIQQIIAQEEVLEAENMKDDREPEIPDLKSIEELHEKLLFQPELESVMPEEEVVEEISSMEEVMDQPVEVELFASAKAEEKTVMEPSTTEIQRTVHQLDVEADEEEEEEKFELASQVHKQKAISSLKTQIGINDKFMIINELFDGSAKRYNAALDEFDAKSNLREALDLLGDMKDENLWDKEDPAFQQFKNYLKRRFQ
jgi:hypothetical protein